MARRVACRGWPGLRTVVYRRAAEPSTVARYRMRQASVGALACLFAVAALALAPSSSTIGRGAATPVPEVAVVSAEDCRAEPRPLDDFDAIAAATPLSYFEVLLRAQIADRPGTPPLGGVPADPAVVAGVAEAIKQQYACLLAGDLARFTALLTDDNFRRNFDGLDPRVVSEALVPNPIRLPLPLYQIEEVLVLPDGRIMVRIQRERGPTLHFYVESNGRYLLDGGFEVVDVATPMPAPLQAATPTPVPVRVATPTLDQAVVDPAECRAEPRPLADVFALAELIPTSATPAPRLSGPPPEDGTPAAPATVAAARDVVRQIVACTATRDVPILTAVWTDDFFRRNLAGIDVEALLRADGGAARAAPMAELIAVRLLPDGRILVETWNGYERAFVALVEEDGRYLVDDIYEPTKAAPPVAGDLTPAQNGASVVPDAPSFASAVSRVTLAPGAVLAAEPNPGAALSLLTVESGGPANVAFDGPATVVWPAGVAHTFPAEGGTATFGPVASLALPGAVGYRLVNDGTEPLVLLRTVALRDAAPPTEPVDIGHSLGVTVVPLGPDPSPATPSA